MTYPARTAYVFGLYLFIVGPLIVFIPNFVLRLYGIPETNEVWLRLIGVIAIVIGAYYLVSAKNEFMPFIRATVPLRLFFCGSALALIVLGYAVPMLLLMIVGDAVGAAWTWWALRQDPKGAPG